MISESKFNEGYVTDESGFLCVHIKWCWMLSLLEFFILLFKLLNFFLAPVQFLLDFVLKQNILSMLVISAVKKIIHQSSFDSVLSWISRVNHPSLIFFCSLSLCYNLMIIKNLFKNILMEISFIHDTIRDRLVTGCAVIEEASCMLLMS